MNYVILNPFLGKTVTDELTPAILLHLASAYWPIKAPELRMIQRALLVKENECLAEYIIGPTVSHSSEKNGVQLQLKEVENSKYVGKKFTSLKQAQILYATAKDLDAHLES